MVTSLTDLMNTGEGETPLHDAAARARTVQGETRLMEAYRNVFSGKGTTDDAEAVLVDLLKVSGYHMTLPASASDAEVRELNGSRKVGGHIAYMMNFDMEVMRELQKRISSELHFDGFTNNQGV